MLPALTAIVTQLRQLPQQLETASPVWVATCGGKLLLEAMRLGAFAGPEWIIFRHTVEKALRGELLHQSPSKPGQKSGSGDLSPDPEWHAFVNGYDAFLLSQGKKGGKFDQEFVRNACLELAKLIEKEGAIGCWIWPKYPFQTADLANRLHPGRDAVPGQVVTISVHGRREMMFARSWTALGRDPVVARWTDDYYYYVPTAEDSPFFLEDTPKRIPEIPPGQGYRLIC